MTTNTNGFVLEATDNTTSARLGRLNTRRGAVRTPAFMPVGTQASVKSLTPDEVESTGAEIVLANTYHLMLRPGAELLHMAGGLHPFMQWERPILTDSGGYQVFSLAHRRKVTEDGVTFRSHLDGSSHVMTPESVIDLQTAFGSDIMMPLDQLVGYESTRHEQREAADRTHRWLERAVQYFHDAGGNDPASRPMLFGIAQGGFDINARRASAQEIGSQGVDGCAIGGLSVGEPKQIMEEMLDASVGELPADRPRYLMGVGSPEDLWQGVASGIDMFDCVHPTRVARRGALFTLDGRVNVTSTKYRTQFEPVDPTCDCVSCQRYSAAYLHHLFRARELLAYRLASIHNLRFLGRQIEVMRASIRDGIFGAEMRTFLDRYQVADSVAAAEDRRAWVRRRESGKR